MIKYILTLLLIPAVCFSAPAVSTVTNGGSTLTISGSGFGTKATPAPAYWNNFNSETSDSPTGLPLITTTGGVISTDQTRGEKSLKYSYSTDSEEFVKNLFDFGSVQDSIYITTWIRLHFDMTEGVLGFQWKNFYVSSDPSGYTAGGLNTSANLKYWYRIDESRWYNAHGLKCISSGLRLVVLLTVFFMSTV